MREKLYAIALAVAQKIAAECLTYNELRVACGDEPTESDCDLVEMRRFVDADKDDFEPCTIRVSAVAIFCGYPVLALAKLLCMLCRHKLRKIRKAEEA